MSIQHEDINKVNFDAYDEDFPWEATPCLELITFVLFTLLVVLHVLVFVVVGALVVVVMNSAQEPSLAAISGGSASQTTMSSPQGVYRCWIRLSNWECKNQAIFQYLFVEDLWHYQVTDISPWNSDGASDVVTAPLPPCSITTIPPLETLHSTSEVQTALRSQPQVVTEIILKCSIALSPWEVITLTSVHGISARALKYSGSPQWPTTHWRPSWQSEW